MWDNLLSGLIGAAVGSVIGGFITLYATKKAHQNNLELERVKSLEKSDAIISSIHDEIKINWELYCGIGQKHLNEAIAKNGHFSMYYNITNDYFSIYHSVASEIGSIEDEALRGDLIRTYAIFKMQLDQFVTNNTLLTQSDEIAMGCAQRNVNLVNRNLAESVLRLKSTDTEASIIIGKINISIPAYRRKIRAEIESLKSR